MEYQENLESYLNLSCKDLQALCKQKNLPAYRSTTQLAKSLTSISKNDVITSALLMVRSSDMEDAALYNLCLPDTKPKQGTHFPEGEAVRGAYEKSVRSSESDTYKVLPVTEDNRCGDMQNCQIHDQLGNFDFMNHQTLDTACETGAIATHACKLNNESTYILDWPLPQHGYMPVNSSVAGDAQHASMGSQFGHWCYHDSNKNESQNFPQKPKNYGEQLLVNNTKDNGAHVLSSRHPRFLKGSKEVGYASSYKSDIKSVPSFDFFMMSNDGINLYVDLNSSTSEWIQKMKDEVCINQKNEHQSLGSLTNHTRDFLDIDVQVKPLQSGSTPLNLQKEEDRGTGFTNSSFGSVFSGTCQEVYPLDATLVSSGSSILTSSSSPIDICNQVVSSSRIPYSNFQTLMKIDNTSFQHKGSMLHDSLDNPSKMEESSTGHEDAEVSIRHDSASTICVKNNILKSDVCLDNMNYSDVGTTETHMCVGNVSSLEIESRCGFSLPSCHEKSLGSCQLGGRSNLNSAADLCQSYSNSLVDYVPMLKSSLCENLIKNVAELEKERLECSAFQNSVDKNSRKACNPEFDEVIPNIKKRRSDRHNKNGCLGLTLSSTEEIVNDAAIPPRRSSRFLSK